MIVIAALLTMLSVSVAVPMLPTARAATTWHVYLNDYYFVPKVLNIQPGDTVVWTSNVTTLHTVTSNTSAWTEMSFSSVGATGSHTFTSGGTYDYHCRYHASFGMWGSVVVAGGIPEFSSLVSVVAGTMAAFVALFLVRERRSTH